MAEGSTKREFFIVDVFAEEKYAGNQLAVFLDGRLYCDEEMQKLAREINFSETVFIFPENGAGRTVKARIFTPAAEVPFAGHPTMGAAYIIAREILTGYVDEVILELPVGRIPVSLTYDAVGNIEKLDMKQIEPSFGPMLDLNTAADILTASVAEIDGRFPSQEVSTGLPFLIIPMKNLAGVKSVQVDQEEMSKLFDRFEARAVLVFCPETYDRKNTLHVRVFAPHLGVYEDPATGSAGGCLAGYLMKYGFFGAGPIDITVEQGYEVGRPSLLRLVASMVDGQISVSVGGKVFLVARGCLL